MICCSVEQLPVPAPPRARESYTGSATFPLIALRMSRLPRAGC
ncbi:hypothetical protein CSE45_1638 [Citreicella sp. SE45]|nr:hypothetical protein CSE45_1638 [Citreicella sp. SE45]